MKTNGTRTPKGLKASELTTILSKRHDELTDEDRQTLLGLIDSRGVKHRLARRAIDPDKIRWLLLKRNADLTPADLALLAGFWGMIRIKRALLEQIETNETINTVSR
jgi:hypothetical protein